MKNRCSWVPRGDRRYERYHDEEWGVPIHDDRTIFEFLVLETFQAGLSWRTVLHKREHFRAAFANFAYQHVARFGAPDVERLLADKGIIRHRGKIEAAITNARRFLEVRDEFGSFDAYMWSWVQGKAIHEAVRWSKDLKKRGFAFLGPTVIYAHMQAVGMVNDHEDGCFLHADAGQPILIP